MPKFSKASRAKLEECDARLVRLFEAVVQSYDCTILAGYRDEADQNTAFRNGRSNKPFPESKHNRRPSTAVDAAPYPLKWEDKEKFYHFAGYVKATSEQMNLPIRWGGDWDSDGDLHDSQLVDLVHFELV